MTMSDLFGVDAIDMPISNLATGAVMPDNLVHCLLILKPWWWRGQSHLKENKCILIELDFSKLCTNRIYFLDTCLSRSRDINLK